MVLAGAGSGKTRTLTYRVAYLLQNGVSPEAILLLTFTNKASKQMLERVEELTGVGAHRFLGGTFHHVGGQVLRLYGDSIGLPRSFTILDDGDSDSLLNEIIRDMDPDFFKSKENPKAKELPVVYASDPEGNDWHYTISSPTMITKIGYSRSTSYDLDEADEICIN